MLNTVINNMHQSVVETWRERRGTAMFEMFPGDQDTNVTRRLSHLVPLVRQVDACSPCKYRREL